MLQYVTFVVRKGYINAYLRFETSMFFLPLIMVLLSLNLFHACSIWFGIVDVKFYANPYGVFGGHGNHNTSRCYNDVFNFKVEEH